jgi:hypothetical protein
MVLACWQTPAGIRHAGIDRIAKLLRRGKVRNAAEVAEAMLAAAHQQTVTLRGQRAAAAVVRELATEILTLHQRVEAIDVMIAEHLTQNPLAPIVQSLPRMGQVLTAELLVHTNNMTEYASAATLAAHAGLAPVSRDSGAVAGNHRGARRFHRPLRQLFWRARLPRSAPAPPPGRITTRNARKAKAITLPCSPSPDAASTSSGPSSATERRSPHPRRTDSLTRPRRSDSQQPDQPSPTRTERRPAARAFDPACKIHYEYMETR